MWTPSTSIKAHQKYTIKPQEISPTVLCLLTFQECIGSISMVWTIAVGSLVKKTGWSSKHESLKESLEVKRLNTFAATTLKKKNQKTQETQSTLLTGPYKRLETQLLLNQAWIFSSPALQNELWNGQPNIFTEWSGVQPVYHERVLYSLYLPISYLDFTTSTRTQPTSHTEQSKNSFFFLEGHFKNPKDKPIGTRMLHLSSPTPQQTSPPIAISPIYWQYDPPKPPLPFGLVYTICFSTIQILRICPISSHFKALNSIHATMSWRISNIAIPITHLCTYKQT